MTTSTTPTNRSFARVIDHAGTTPLLRQLTDAGAKVLYEFNGVHVLEFEHEPSNVRCRA